MKKTFALYTKTFGGKIWKHLHSVSPDKIFGKKFKMASLTILRQSYVNLSSCKKKLTEELISFLLWKKKSEKKLLRPSTF